MSTRSVQLVCVVFCLLVGIIALSCLAPFISNGRLVHMADKFLSRPAFAAEGEQKPSQPEQKQQEPALKVAGKFTGVNESEGIKLLSNTADFHYKFQIEATENEVKDLRVLVYPFTGPDLAQVETKWTVNGEPGDKAVVTVPGLQAKPLEISAQLPLVGEYKSTISLIYNNKRWPIPLTVTRARPNLSIEVTKIETATDVSFYPRKDASIRLTIQEKDGRRISLDKPALTYLSLVGANKSKVQAHYGKVTILDESGNEITSGFELGPGPKELRLIVGELSGPGEFSGNVRVSTPDAEPVDQPITILRKKSGWIAGFLIFVGVLISFLLRRYATTARPRLVRQRRALALTSDIDELERTSGELTEGEQDVLKELRKRLSTLYEDIAMATDNKADDTLQEINRKLNIFPTWVQERRRVDSLRPAELQEDFRTELEKVRTYMLKRQATSEEDADAAKILAGTAPNMAKKVKEDLEEHLKSFSAEINAQRLATKSEAVRARLGAEVDTKITAAQELLKVDRLDDARAAYDQARLAYARILTDELANTLPTAVPLGFKAPDWDNLRSQTMDIITQARLAADADNATKLYQSAVTLYLRNLAWKLQGAIEELRGNIPTDTHITDEKKTAYDTTLLSLKQKLDDALLKIDAGKLSEAAADYEAAKDELLTLNQQLPVGTSMGVAAAASAATSADAGTAGSVPGAFDLPFLGAILGRGRGPLPSFSKLTRWLSIFDLMVTLVVLLVAVFFGLKLLWSDAATWGGWNDYLTAILWGLGLHQVSGVATQGAADIVAKLAPRSS
jgi:hypothetical protein